MTQTTDLVIPLATLVSRFEKQREQLRHDTLHRDDLTDMQRAVLNGAISAYGVEIDALLEMGGRSQPVWKHTA